MILYNKINISIMPESPGIYRIFTLQKKCVYIGKAKNLKNRLFQHLNDDEPNKILKGILSNYPCFVEIFNCSISMLDYYECRFINDYYLKNRKYPDANILIP